MKLWRLSGLCLLAGLLLSTTPIATAQMQDWPSAVWTAALQGREDLVLDTLARHPAGEDRTSERLASSIERLKKHIANREAERLEQMKTVEAELEKALAEPRTDLSLSRALRSAVELYMLSTDKSALLARPKIKDLRREAESAARSAESRGDVFTASELFSRLDSLYEETGHYKSDVIRQTTRLQMIRLYAPERFWHLRNERRRAEGEKPLPPYNPLGDRWAAKLDGINKSMVLRALNRSANEHVERDRGSLATMLTGGIEGVRTMLTTDDLGTTFPGIRDAQARARVLSLLTTEEARLARPGANARYSDLDSLIDRLLATNEQSTKIAETALLHEFANGAMGRLDEFSSIIWPDEIRRFNKSTQGNFIGVGIQIQLDELARIKVVTPLEDTPAQRAGIRAGDLITKVNGQSTEGFTLDQAVDVITGPQDTAVTLTITREIDGEKTDRDVRLVRARIKVGSVKGWRKLGLADDQWDWFVDRESRIGYVRLTGFTEETDREFDRAVEQMKAEGLRGIILDLRFNPGGLLEQAVAIASRFIEPGAGNRYDGLVVSTHTIGDRVVQREQVERGRASLTGVPVVVLINEGSASASEIVSGAIQDYSSSGEVRGLLVGQRTFGKGSVQNVWQLPGQGVIAAIKLTTQYYKLPGGRLIHRKTGAPAWGVQPNLGVEMLPKQIAEAFLLRQNADVIRLNDKGQPAPDAEGDPNPDDLLAKGLDLQLEYALVLLQSQTVPVGGHRAQLDRVPEASPRN